MFSGQIEFNQSGQADSEPFSGLACCISERLHIRLLTLEDADALFLLTDTNRAYLRRWLPWLDSTLSPEDTRAFISRGMEKAQLGQELVSAICYDGAIVGLVGLHEINWHSRSGGIGYWLSAAHQGKGIMTFACASLLDYGFATLNLNRIDICCAASNRRSEAIAKRLGMTYEGTLREAEWLYDHFVDWRIYSMLSREWKARSS